MNKIVLALFTCAFIACTSSKKENVKQEESIGQFLYLDRYNCLHTNRDCVMLIIGGETENSSHTNYPVTFIKVEEIKSLDVFKFCSDCFTDKLYENLVDIVNNNNRQWQNQDTITISKELQGEIDESIEGAKRIK